MVQVQAPGTGKLQHAFLPVVIAVVADGHVLKELAGTGRVGGGRRAPCVALRGLDGLFQRPPQRVRLVDLLHADQGVHGPLHGLVELGRRHPEELILHVLPVAHHHGHVLSR